MSRPNFERLRQAFAIIDGIPARVFNLDAWVSRDNGPQCGTIACAGGWLAMHPDMHALGLTRGFDGSPRLRYETGSDALARLFDCTPQIFSGAGYGYKDLEARYRRRLTHKKLWKRRVLRLFQEYDEPFDPKVSKGLHLDAR